MTQRDRAILKLYSGTVERRYILLLFSLIAILGIIQVIVEPYFIQLCDSVCGDLPTQDGFRSFVFTILFLFAYDYFFEKILAGNWLSLNSLITFSSIFIIYLVRYRNGEELQFFQWFDTPFYLTDLLFLICLSFASDYKYLTPLLIKGPNSLLEDDPHKVENDLLGRDQYIEKVRDAIQDTAADRAIGISILAEWGFGKTVFMNLLKNRLEEDTTTIIIEFNPWIGERSQSTIKHFFEALEEKLQKYDSSASRKISQYTNDLLQPVEADDLWTKLAKTGTSLIFPNETTIQEKEAINKIISRIGKRIVVLIDDLDRLNGEELSDVMRLIRNTADFKKTFFVAALDRNYVLNVLNESNMVESRDRYLEKIFQLEILLPPIRKDIIKEQLIEALQPVIRREKEENLAKGRVDISVIEEIINDHWFNDRDLLKLQPLWNRPLSTTLIKLFTNLRDVQRFSNIFCINYEMIRKFANHEKVILNDFFLLELIKFKSPSLYTLLANETILIKNLDGKIWDIDEEQINNIFEPNSERGTKLSIPEGIKETLKIILETLFSANDNESQPLRVRIVENHSFYFNYSNELVFETLRSLDEGYNSLIEYIDKLANKI